MAEKAKAKYLNTPVRHKGETLEVGTKIDPDHEEYADMEKQGWLVESKELAEAKPEAIGEALTETSEKLTAANAKIADLEKDNKVLADALADANAKIADLSKPATK